MQHGRFFIETYGCQMNMADSDIVVSLLEDQGYVYTSKPGEADLILINSCSVREKAEQRVRNRLRLLGRLKQEKKNMLIGLIGCMAERLKDKLLEEEKTVDLVIGPDAYRNLPDLLVQAWSGQKAVDTVLSTGETYADITPVRKRSGKVAAFVSIMRGCDNFCSYCVVPYTRGRERSRDPETITGEIRRLHDDGYLEVTLLGQNVNSYHWVKNDVTLDFPALLGKVAGISSDLRVRFTTSHPKDLSDQLLHTMAAHDNICRHIHLPLQSGSNPVLKRMMRKYTRESYLDRVRAIRSILPGGSLTTDIIAGFCGETERDHRETMEVMDRVGYDFAYMFRYSERPGTIAAGKFANDVPEKVKIRRLNEIIALQGRLSEKSKKQDLHKTFQVLVEGPSKKSSQWLSGRTSQNKVVVFPGKDHRPGTYVNVRITDYTQGTLIGETVS